MLYILKEHEALHGYKELMLHMLLEHVTLQEHKTNDLFHMLTKHRALHGYIKLMLHMHTEH